MAKASISVTLDIRVLSRAAELTNQALGTVVQDLADEIVEDAKAVVPVATGELRDSIEAEVISELEIDVIAGAGHAAYVEYGTQRMPARPYLTPAVEKAKERLPALVGEALDGLWKEAGGR